MRFFRLMAITVLLLACVVLGTACAGAKGEEGPQGAKGDTGAAGISVQNIVNNGNGTFTVNLTNGTAYTTDNLTGPKGDTGAQGIQGVQGIQGNPGTPGIGVEWVGQWDSATLYAKYDAVGYQGSSYISKQPNNTNHVPTDTNWWDLWVEKGDTGSTGAPGVDGEDGAPGPNMIVAMGSVYDSGSGPSLVQDYNVETCVWNSGNGWYDITLTGINYSESNYVTLVSSHTHSAGYAGLGDGHLIVWVSDIQGALSHGSFSFMVLECPS